MNFEVHPNFEKNQSLMIGITNKERLGRELELHKKTKQAFK
jgi:bacterioferritin (cytochrome b1)